MAKIKSSKTSSTKLNSALKERLDLVREKLATVEKGSAVARYEVGMLVADVMKDQATYGDNAVGALEGELGLDAKTLYRYGAVTRTWDQAAFDVVMSRANKQQQPITWTHLVAISRAVDGLEDPAMSEKRDLYTNMVLDESLTPRTLREKIANEAPDRTDRPLTSLKDLNRSMVRVLANAKQLATVLVKLSKTPSKAAVQAIVNARVHSAKLKEASLRIEAELEKHKSVAAVKPKGAPAATRRKTAAKKAA